MTPGVSNDKEGMEGVETVKLSDRQSFYWDDVSSTVPWVGQADVVVDNNSSHSLRPEAENPKQDCPVEIKEEFSNLKELVNELLTVENSQADLEGNVGLVQGLLVKLEGNKSCEDILLGDREKM